MKLSHKGRTEKVALASKLLIYHAEARESLKKNSRIKELRTNERHLKRKLKAWSQQLVICAPKFSTLIII